MGFCFYFRQAIKLYSLDWPRTYFVDQVGIEFRAIFPPQSLKCWVTSVSQHTWFRQRFSKPSTDQTNRGTNVTELHKTKDH